MIGPCGRRALPIYDRTDNPNAVHAIRPGARVTVADNGFPVDEASGLVLGYSN